METRAALSFPDECDAFPPTSTSNETLLKKKAWTDRPGTGRGRREGYQRNTRGRERPGKEDLKACVGGRRREGIEGRTREWDQATNMPRAEDR